MTKYYNTKMRVIYVQRLIYYNLPCDNATRDNLKKPN